MKPHTRKFKQATSQPTLAPLGKPIIETTERERSEASLKVYHLSPDELEAYKQRTGYPTRPLGKFGSGNKDTMHMLRQPRGPVA